MMVGKQRGKIILLFLGLFLLVVLALFHNQTRDFFYSFSVPIQKKLWVEGGKVADFFQNIFHPRNIASELRQVQDENQLLLANVVKFAELEKENSVLRAALDIGLNKEFGLSLARITGRPADGIVLLDQGRDQGVEIGQAVITEQKTLCGKVKAVYQHSAAIELIFGKDISFDAVILSGPPVLVKGEGGGRLLLNLIPKNSAIKKGDIVFSAALSGIFPAGLLVGRVEEIISSDAQPFAQATAQASCDVNNLERVFIIMKK
ncbi:MAG: rod shape-determining protein MreC [Patescibacteria group bacterium]